MKRKKALLISFLFLEVFLGSGNNAWAFHFPVQDKTTANSSSSFIADDFHHFVNVGVSLFTAPLHFGTHQWQKTGEITCATALLFLADKSSRNLALHNHNSFNNNLFNVDSYYGNIYTLVVPFVSYGYGALAGNSKVRRIGLYATEAFFYSGAITGIFKVIIGRRRPYSGESNLVFKPFQLGNDSYKSLPSGHSTVSFAVSTVMAKSVDNTVWKVFWYSAASLTCASRIYHNKHWLSDVFLGAAIGYSVGDYIVHFNEEENPPQSKIQIQPFISVNTIGLVASF